MFQPISIGGKLPENVIRAFYENTEVNKVAIITTLQFNEGDASGYALTVKRKVSNYDTPLIIVNAAMDAGETAIIDTPFYLMPGDVLYGLGTTANVQFIIDGYYQELT